MLPSVIGSSARVSASAPVAATSFALCYRQWRRPGRAMFRRTGTDRRRSSWKRRNIRASRAVQE